MSVPLSVFVLLYCRFFHRTQKKKIEICSQIQARQKGRLIFVFSLSLSPSFRRQIATSLHTQMQASTYDISSHQLFLTIIPVISNCGWHPYPPVLDNSDLETKNYCNHGEVYENVQQEERSQGRLDDRFNGIEN